LKKLFKTIEQVEEGGEFEDANQPNTTEPATSSSPVEGFASPGTVNSYGYNMTPNTANSAPESFQKGAYYHGKQKKRPEEMYLTAQDLIHRVDAVFSQQRNGLEAWIMQGATNEFKVSRYHYLIDVTMCLLTFSFLW
jgi:hypothetical protein